MSAATIGQCCAECGTEYYVTLGIDGRWREPTWHAPGEMPTVTVLAIPAACVDCGAVLDTEAERERIARDHFDTLDEERWSRW